MTASNQSVRRLRAAGLLGIIGVFLVFAAGPAAPEAESPKTNASVTGIPDEWLEGSPESRAKRFDGLKTGEAPPELKVTNWKNGDPLKLSALKGKVVMLDFWATWCGPCIASIPHNNELLERYKADGLVIIGVCNTQGSDEMGKTIESKGIKYPVAADVDDQTVERYAVDSYPDYYFIDRAGKLRIVDCKNDHAEDAIKLLLSEKGK
jgi:thiol-disulfide isomerase/thioredoxin